LFGGYPTGARGIKALLDKREINEDQARKMIYFVVGAGPAFVISVVGTSLLKSFQAGITLFICQFLASLIIGILINLKKEEKKYKNINTKIREFPENIAISKAFVDSCTDATHAMINMCSLVVIFCSIFLILKTTYINSVIYTLIRNFGASETISESFLPAILEVTNGCKTACCLGVPYIFLAFIIGFSGLCVHFQIFSSVSDIAFSKIKFIFFRILHGFFSAILTEIAFSIWPASVEASLNIVHNNQTFNTYWVTSSSLSLIFLSACFLLTLSPKIIEIRDKNKNKCTKKELEKL
jgi:sporulation integral membrane protein YlbJ